jgi:hypothetical protein
MYHYNKLIGDLIISNDDNKNLYGVVVFEELTSHFVSFRDILGAISIIKLYTD